MRMWLTEHATRRAWRILASAVVLAAVGLTPYAVQADNTPQSLPFSQNWSNTGLITAANDWSGVPGIVGYRGDALTGSTGTDPQTIVVDGTGTPVNVLANQTNPNTLTTGGIAEFDTLPDPTVAFQGSGTARAPFLLINVNTTGQSGIQVSYNLRDVDGSADNAVQPVALQYRVGSSGNFTNLPAGFVADASSGPSAAGQVTPVLVILPADAGNQPLVQIRIITTDAVGSDEWIGIDDISVIGGALPTLPTGIGSAVPASVSPGDTTLLKVAVTPGANPPSTGITVRVNLAPIGGAAPQPFFDDGTHGDATAGDNVFSFLATVDGATTPGDKVLVLHVEDAESRSSNGPIHLTVIAPPPIVPIDVIQGSGSISLYAGQTVTTTGIVTAVVFNGFFLQTPDGADDGDPLTSEGVFVFTSSAPVVAVGDAAKVTATVQEFIPSADPFSPPATELASPTVVVQSSGNPLPTPISLTAADTSPTGSIEQLERYEGMRVHVDSLTAVSPTQGTINEPSATSTTNGVFYGVITGIARPFREPGVEVPDPLPSGAPPTVTRFDANPERLRVDSDRQAGAVALEVTSGAVVTGLTGPLDYSFRTYTILPDPATPPTVSGNVTATPIAAPGPGQFTVAAFNVERLFDTVNDPAIGEPVLTPTAFQNRLGKISLVIRNLMRSPDIVGLEEVENLATLQSVADKVNADAVAAGGEDPGYVAYLEEGNDIGGIDVGFLVKSSRVTVVDVTQEGKDATYINPNNGQPELLNDRPSLVLRARILRPGGAPSFPVTVIVNHLRSLSGIDDPADGNRVRTKRRAQAEFLANLVQHRQATDPAEHIVLVGDFNAFQFSDGYVDVIGTVKGTPTPADEVVLASDDLVNPDLTDLVETVPADQRYSYSFDGNAQTIDHVLVTGNLLGSFAGAQFARTDADFPESLRNDPTRPERVSDHDPVVATFDLPAAAPSQTTLASSLNPSGFGQPVTFTATVVSAGHPATEGSVTFREGATVLAGPVFLDASGHASFATSSLGVGNHTITADYSGAPLSTPSSGSVVQSVLAGLSVSDAFVVEGSTGTTFLAFVVTLAPASAAPVTVNVATANGSAIAGSDYTAVSGTLTFTPGVTRRAVFVPVSGDNTWEEDETLTLRLTGATNAAVTDGEGVGTILNDDPLPAIVVGNSIVAEGNSGTTMVFVVRLSNPSSRTVTVDYATMDGTAQAGSDYTAAAARLSFPPGTLFQIVGIHVVGDVVNEPSEFFFLQLANPANAAIAYGRGIGIIVNDDAWQGMSADDAAGFIVSP
jgi:hypothetical protein